MKGKTEKQKFKEFLKKAEDPNYQREINRALPPNATSLQVAKYKLCKQMLIYQQENTPPNIYSGNKNNYLD